jgi:hypothetical protein
MQTGYRGFLLTGKDEFLEPYRTASQPRRWNTRTRSWVVGWSLSGLSRPREGDHTRLAEHLRIALQQLLRKAELDSDLDFLRVLRVADRYARKRRGATTAH